MPVNKDALARYRVIDKLLSDPHNTYTTEEIRAIVNRECSERVSLRMIQKDIKSLEEDFGKSMVRNAGGRAKVKYQDQSEPLFYQELTLDEEAVLREALKTMGQFEGLDNFTWLDLLKKKLDFKAEADKYPLISFGDNSVLQIHPTLLARLFTAISRKKVIRIRYTPFNRSKGIYDVYPYQLRQYNNRWYLLMTPVGNDKLRYDPNFIANFALDRMDSDFEYLEDIPFVETKLDLKMYFDEIVGMTLRSDEEVEYIYYAVAPTQVEYVRTKWIHRTQMELEGEELKNYRSMYPSLEDWGFFSIECRPNFELYTLFVSFGENLVVLEPTRIREKIAGRMRAAADNYGRISGE